MTAALARLAAAHAGHSGVRLLDDGPAALAVRLALVRRARVAIDAQYYIWRDDVAGRLLRDELVAAAARGVTVRLLIDDFGSPAAEALFAGQPGLAVRLFNPARLRWPRWANALFDFPRLNRRMHNKALVVDGVACVIGGRNIGDEYFDAGHAVLAVDLDVLAIGAIAGEVAQDFAHYWQSAAAVPLERLVPALPGGPPLLPPLLPSAPPPDPLLDAGEGFTWADVIMVSDPPAKVAGGVAADTLLLPRLLAAIGPVTRRLLLVSAYFIPGREGAALLARLVEQGVRVEVLTNSLLSNNVALVHAWYAPWRRRLLRAGVRLWEMRGRAGDRVTLGLVPRRLRRRPDPTSFFRSSAAELHAKSFVADGRWLFVGSVNFDPRSWRLNTELGFLIDSPELAGRLEAQIDVGLPEFAWAVEEHGGHLAWREDGHLLQPEPGTSWLHRLVYGLLALLPLAGFF